VKALVYIVLTTTLLSTGMGCRKVELPDFVTTNEKHVMETDECWSKGGLGIIMSPNDANLYAVTRSFKNEIDWGYGENSGKWAGQSASTPEVVVFFNGKVWNHQTLPHEFDKNKSVVVSFEEKSIRFYDFIHMSGGYYERHDPNE